MGPARADRALDGPNLALCLSHGRARVFDALQVVPSSECDAGSRACQVDTDKVVCGSDGNLALGQDLMFDHTDALRRIEQLLW